LHVPYSPQQASQHPGAPSLPVEVITDALRIAVRVVLEAKTDSRIAAGAEH
jgi:pyroglutamyl-peptidase